MEKVTKIKFDAFIESYPNKLEKDITHVVEPPILTYNDFTSGATWPGSIIAKVKLWDAMKAHPLYEGEKNEYYIKQ